MLQNDLIGQRLVETFFLGWLLFNYPLLALFNDAASLFGIPMIYVYLFGAWALLIGLMAFLVERESPGRHEAPDAATRPSLKD